MENKQTAVEWLMEQITYDNDNKRLPSFIESYDLSKFFEEAKQIEKKQTGDWVETHWYEEIDGKNYKLYYDKNNEWK
jgi:hypothetical protein